MKNAEPFSILQNHHEVRYKNYETIALLQNQKWICVKNTKLLRVYRT